MSESKVQVSGGTISFTALLGAVLVVLKLLGKIRISWFWVLAPFWLPWALVLGFTALIAAIIFIAGLLEYRNRNKRFIRGGF
jgi:hypothetical protein